VSANRAKLAGFGIYQNQERMAPAFKLPCAAGRELALWDYKQRQPLVLYFWPEPSQVFLRHLQTEYPAYQDIGAELMVITTYPSTQLFKLAAKAGLTYPLLTDEQKRIYRRYLDLIEADQAQEKAALLFIVSRFGATSRYATAPGPDQLPPQSEILEFLEFLGNLCNP
jgi:peroxiredoxin